jgi:hypothetical protein
MTAAHQSRIAFFLISVIARFPLRAERDVEVSKKAIFSIIIKRCGYERCGWERCGRERCGRERCGWERDITIWRCVRSFTLRYRYTENIVILHSKSGSASVLNRYKPNIVTTRIVISRFYCTHFSGLGTRVEPSTQRAAGKQISLLSFPITCIYGFITTQTSDKETG